MIRLFIPSIVLVVVGSLCITFSMTKIMSETVFWSLFLGGTVLNIIGVIVLYIRFQKNESRENKLE